MGWLSSPEVQTRHYLAERSLIGRAIQCWLRINHTSVSKEHAIVAYEAGGWTVKDLGSRNGTWANGKRLDPGVSTRVDRHSSVRFGDIELSLEESDPPTLCAQKTRTGDYLVAKSGLLSLPDDDNPTASISEVAPRVWTLDHLGQVTTVQDGDTVYVGDQRFLLRVPGPSARRLLESTVRVGAEVGLADLTLRLDVSRDQESIATRLEGETRSLEVPSRTTHQLLLVLARKRLDDRCSGVVEDECGWVYSDELAGMMGADLQKVNVDVYRLRQQLAALGVAEASRIVERRPTSHQVRLGMPRIVIG